MEERHYAGVYWEDRKVTREEAVPHVLGFLGRLKEHDPLMSRWYVLRDTQEESLASGLDGPEALPILDAGMREAVEGQPEYGWRVVVWNGELGESSVKIELDFGADIRSHATPTPNSCIVRLPRGAFAKAQLRRAPMTRLLGELAIVWDADWGVVSTDLYVLQGPGARAAHHPRVGWLTFLNGWRGPAPKLSRVAVTPVQSLGYVVATEDDHFDSDDAGAVARVRDMEDQLEQAKRLEPYGSKTNVAPGVAPLAPPAVGDAGSGTGYGAALDAASAVDALTSRLPGRRADLVDGLHRASTGLAMALATGDDGARPRAELLALLDLVARLFPESAVDEVARAREALDRVVR